MNLPVKGSGLLENNHRQGWDRDFCRMLAAVPGGFGNFDGFIVHPAAPVFKGIAVEYFLDAARPW